MNLRSHPRPLLNQCGVALIAVLWLVAALSIVMLGVAKAVRTEVRIVGQAREAVEAAAIGDAAIYLALQTVLASPEGGKTKISSTEFVFQGVPVWVEVRSVNGFLDIGRAPKDLLQAAYRIVGGLDTQTADATAQATVDMRSKKDSQGVEQGFGVPEDLLTVPGINYDLYVKLRHIITTDADSSGKINPHAAPYDLLLVISDGNVANSASFMSARDSGASGLDTTRFNSAFIDISTSSRLRLSATVPLKGGSQLVSSRTVDLVGGEKEGLPWRTLHSERSMRHGL